jgi:cobalt-precorrin 5A hydrolase
VEILNGNDVGFKSDFPVSGSMPECLKFMEKFKMKKPSQIPKSGIMVSLSGAERPFQTTLNVVPKIVTAGIGCRKNISKELLQTKLQEALKSTGISKDSLMGLASIDIKGQEEGLISLGKEWNLPIKFFSKEELLEVEGSVNHSFYVEKVTGVGNVCERAAILATGGGKLLLEKKAGNGITIALAVKEWRVDFEYPNDWNRS